MNGFLNILKPPGMTSHDVVSHVRKSFKIKKVGHLGTLDPGAAGVLPIAIGRATKFAEYIINQEKKYRFELILGETTDTLDAQGVVTNQSEVTQEHINNLIENFSELTGEISQVPPMYSAIKQKGKKLYELAREGQEVERPARQIKIYSLTLIDHYVFKGKTRFLFEVNCSKGTYIRTLGHDLAKLSGCGEGHVSFLLRSKSGDFDLNSSISLETLIKKSEELQSLIQPIDIPLNDFPSLVISDDKEIRKFRNGNVSFVSNHHTKNETLRVYNSQNDFLGLGKVISNNKVKPEKVIN
ncbi:tRNA pseudouridine(55) synthase TruB [Natranaerobius trueperi]|nr:tRNA pseudouridine(55) synthase TruB [Natranaerobius trueperi]